MTWGWWRIWRLVTARPCEECGDRRRCWRWHVERFDCPVCGTTIDEFHPRVGDVSDALFDDAEPVEVDFTADSLGVFPRLVQDPYTAEDKVREAAQWFVPGRRPGPARRVATGRTDRVLLSPHVTVDAPRLSRDDLAKVRNALRANMFDGDEGGKVTMAIRELLEEVVENIDIALNGEAAWTYVDEEGKGI